ncbi:putative hydroxypyruvate isomerase isoform X2 [Dendropsophus ebraccatus]|uniref:putative hydroxypyruvate isomerase isoform X2 n=1 Tax=Dendropsophus ebraccatus TaxID=150705 RepID=UPI003831D932
MAAVLLTLSDPHNSVLCPRGWALSTGRGLAPPAHPRPFLTDTPAQHLPVPVTSLTSPAPLTLLGSMRPALRFAANISWLFPEIPELLGRIRAAGRAGFRAVEVAWPYESDPGEVKAALRESNVKLVLLNTPPGDLSAGELGLGAVPGRQDGFRAGLDQAITWARELGCTRIHIMAGRVPSGTDRASIEKQMEETFIENLRYAADILSQVGIVGLIEPINCRISEPRYFLNTPQQGASILQKVGRPNVKMQMDLYHWQIMDGNLTENIKTYFPLIGDTVAGLRWMEDYRKCTDQDPAE